MRSSFLEKMVRDFVLWQKRCTLVDNGAGAFRVSFSEIVVGFEDDVLVKSSTS